MPLSLGFSFCPNDTFIFYALSRGLTSLGEVSVVMADVEELNSLVIRGKLDISKVSIGVLPEVKDGYLLLDAGGAFGFEEAPVVISKSPISVSKLRTLAAPGRHTTAYMLYRRLLPPPERVLLMRYDEIIPAVVKGEVDAGILIHEGRFTYQDYGLMLLADLGELWRKQVGNLPVPLGGVVIRRELSSLKRAVEDAIRESIAYAKEHVDEVMPFVKRHAQELSEDVIKKHIDAFVNQLTWNMGPSGREAVERLLGSF